MDDPAGGFPNANYTTNADAVLNVANRPNDILANDSSTTGDPLTIIGSDSNSVNGATVMVNADGSFTYDPTGSAALQQLDEGQILAFDTFTYTITDATTPPDGLMDVQVINTVGPKLTTDGESCIFGCCHALCIVKALLA